MVWAIGPGLVSDSPNLRHVEQLQCHVEHDPETRVIAVLASRKPEIHVLRPSRTDAMISSCHREYAWCSSDSQERFQGSLLTKSHIASLPGGAIDM